MVSRCGLQRQSLYVMLMTGIGCGPVGPSMIRAEVETGASSSHIVSPDAKLERLFDGGCFLTEGVAAGPDGSIYFSDITLTDICRDERGVREAGHMWRYDPATGKTSIFRSPSGMSNGKKFDAHGNMIVAEGADFGGRRVIRTDMKTGKSYIIAGLFEGRPFNAPNDVALDEKGRIYFTDPRYGGHEPVEQPVMGVYRIDQDGSIHRIIADLGKPNGIAVSPDQKTLYVGSQDDGATGLLPEGARSRKGDMCVWQYDLAEDGTVGNKRQFANYLPEDGPDGLVPDVEGNLYVAVRNVKRPGIYIYSPEGKELAYIPTRDLPTYVGFGRAEERKTLYVTSGKCLYRIKLEKEGYQLPPNQ